MDVGLGQGLAVPWGASVASTAPGGCRSARACGAVCVALFAALGELDAQKGCQAWPSQLSASSWIIRPSFDADAADRDLISHAVPAKPRDGSAGFLGSDEM